MIRDEVIPKMNTGQRIKKLREARGISRKDFADSLKITPSSLCRWENGDRNIREDRLREIAFLLKVPVTEILGEVAIVQEPTSYSKNAQHALYQDWINIPVYRSFVNLQFRLQNSTVDEVLALPSFLVGRISEDARERPFVIVVEGDSMTGAGICERSPAVVNPAEEILDGDAVLAKVDARYVIRWFYRKGEDQCELRASSERYPHIEIKSLQAKGVSFAILGKIMWALSRPKVGL